MAGGGGSDRFGVIFGLSGGDCAWPQLGGRFEQGPALLLAVSLVAVIRLPRWAGSLPATAPGTSPAIPGRARASRYPAAGNAGRCAIRSVSVPASATGRSGEPDYPARHDTGTRAPAARTPRTRV
jgi:hypothetical protein